MFNKLFGIVKQFFKNWKHPAENDFVPNKEIIAYSVGGMGVQFISSMVNQIGMTATCLLIGSVYKIPPMQLGILAGINTVVMILTQPLKAMMIDNTRTKAGKFRPYILWFGIPSAIFTIAFAYIPVNLDLPLKVTIVGILFILMQFFYNIYFNAYTQLSQVISPNTNERTKIISISSIVYSMGPTITGALIPLIAKAIGGERALLEIKVYQVILPAFCIVGLFISYLAYFGTKERIVVSKDYVAKVKFIDGMKKILQNKYLWITTVSGWFTFLKGASTIMLTWIYLYQIQSMAAMAALSLVMGTASLIGMVCTPILVNKIGKKNVIIWSHIVFTVFSLGVMIFANNIFILMICLYILFAATSTSIITGPAVGADVYDYQQYKTGDRLEGFSGNFSIISNIIGLATILILPMIFEGYGIFESYDVLYDKAVRTPLYTMLGLLGAIGSVLCMAPYFFYDLTEAKHKAIIEVLKIRALEKNKDLGIEETMEELQEELKS